MFLYKCLYILFALSIYCILLSVYEIAHQVFEELSHSFRASSHTTIIITHWKRSPSLIHVAILLFLCKCLYIFFTLSIYRTIVRSLWNFRLSIRCIVTLILCFLSRNNYHNPLKKISIINTCNHVAMHATRTALIHGPTSRSFLEKAPPPHDH